MLPSHTEQAASSSYLNQTEELSGIKSKEDSVLGAQGLESKFELLDTKEQTPELTKKEILSLDAIRIGWLNNFFLPEKHINLIKLANNNIQSYFNCREIITQETPFHMVTIEESIDLFIKSINQCKNITEVTDLGTFIEKIKDDLIRSNLIKLELLFYLRRVIEKLSSEYSDIIQYHDLEIIHSFDMCKELTILFFTYLLNLILITCKYNKKETIFTFEHSFINLLYGDFLLTYHWYDEFLNKVINNTDSQSKWVDSIFNRMKSSTYNMYGKSILQHLSKSMGFFTHNIIYWINFDKSSPLSEEDIVKSIDSTEEMNSIFYSGLLLRSMFSVKKTTATKEDKKTFIPEENFKFGNEFEYFLGDYNEKPDLLLKSWNDNIKEKCNNTLQLQEQHPQRFYGGHFFSYSFFYDGFSHRFFRDGNIGEQTLEITHPPYKLNSTYKINDIDMSVYECIDNFVFNTSNKLNLIGQSGHKHLDILGTINHDTSLIFRFSIDVYNQTWFPRLFKREQRSRKQFPYLSQLSNERKHELQLISCTMNLYNLLLDNGNDYNTSDSSQAFYRFVQILNENKYKPLNLLHLTSDEDSSENIPSPTHTIEFRFFPCPQNGEEVKLIDNLIIAWVNTVKKEHLERMPLEELSLKDPVRGYTDEEVKCLYEAFIVRLGLNFETYSTLMRI